MGSNQYCPSGQAIVLRILNDWWSNKYVPAEELKARVILIYKKGDKALIASYRPISLLNSLYKIYATILQRRLASGMIISCNLCNMAFVTNVPLQTQ